MDYDVIVIGSGPGGYTSACLAAKNGKKTAIIEKDKIGGVCLNIGCIPTKALINIANGLNSIKKNDLLNIETSKIDINMVKAAEKVLKISENVSKGVEFLFKTNNVEVIKGTATVIDKNSVMVNNDKLSADNIIIATGSSNKNISSLIEDKITDKNKIITSTEALALDKIPTSITILGGGAIGVEFAHIFNALGSEVTIIEFFPNLVPGLDIESSRTLERSFTRKKIKILTNSKVKKIDQNDKSLSVTYEKSGEEGSINSEYILNALGRSPNTEKFDIGDINLDMEKGSIKINKFMQTSISNIYAVGDVVSDSPLLAHVAYDEARAAVEHILKKENSFTLEHSLIPYCIYTDPQIASFGMTEKEAEESKIEFSPVKVFFKASGKAQAIEKTDGFVKLLVDNKKEMLIGAHICGPDATELIHELLLLSKAGLKLKEIADTMHAHPTLSESIAEAAKSYYKLSLH